MIINSSLYIGPSLYVKNSLHIADTMSVIVLQPCLDNAVFWGKSILFDTKEYENQIDGESNAAITHSSALALDGIDSDIDTNIKVLGGSAVYFEREFIPRADADQGLVYCGALNNTSAGIQIKQRSGRLIQVRISDGLGSAIYSFFAVTQITLDVKNTIIFDWSGIANEQGTLTINGTEETFTPNQQWAGDSHSNILLGVDFNNLYANEILLKFAYNFEILYDFQSFAGCTVINKSLYSGIDGVINGTVAWVGEDLQYPNSLKEGFNKYRTFVTPETIANLSDYEVFSSINRFWGKYSSYDAIACESLLYRDAQGIILHPDSIATTSTLIANIPSKLGLLPQYSYIDTLPRKQSQLPVFAGNTIQVAGSGGISAAYASASAEDTLQLADGIYNSEDETGGYLIINAAKSIRIKGNSLDNTLVTIKNTTASYLVRFRNAGTVILEDLTLEHNTAQGLYYDPNFNNKLYFKNCKIINESGVVITGFTTLATVNERLEFLNTEIVQNATSSIFSLGKLNENTPIYIENCIIRNNGNNRTINFDDTNKVDICLYDTEIYQDNGDMILSFGSDNLEPVNNQTYVDIRGCNVSYINGLNQGDHAVLIGRGTTENTFFINNTLTALYTGSGSSLGLVLKCIGTELNNCIVKGNHLIGSRPFYVKGGQYIDAQFNTVSNTNKVYYGVHINNPQQLDGAINSRYNTFKNNTVFSLNSPLAFDSNTSEKAQETAAFNDFDNNTYYSQRAIDNNDNRYIIDEFSNNVKFEDKGTYWDQDQNSNYSDVRELTDAYGNELNYKQINNIILLDSEQKYNFGATGILTVKELIAHPDVGSKIYFTPHRDDNEVLIGISGVTINTIAPTGECYNQTIRALNLLPYARINEDGTYRIDNGGTYIIDARAWQ